MSVQIEDNREKRVGTRSQIAASFASSAFFPLPFALAFAAGDTWQGSCSLECVVLHIYIYIYLIQIFLIYIYMTFIYTYNYIYIFIYIYASLCTIVFIHTCIHIYICVCVNSCRSRFVRGLSARASAKLASLSCTHSPSKKNKRFFALAAVFGAAGGSAACVPEFFRNPSLFRSNRRYCVYFFSMATCPNPGMEKTCSDFSSNRRYTYMCMIFLV